jgi:hypothetical protein
MGTVTYTTSMPEGTVSDPRCWVVLTFGEDRQYGGNAGYEDTPNKEYRYDS